jgi:hypothetical protein
VRLLLWMLVVLGRRLRGRLVFRRGRSAIGWGSGERRCPERGQLQLPSARCNSAPVGGVPLDGGGSGTTGPSSPPGQPAVATAGREAPRELQLAGGGRAGDLAGASLARSSASTLVVLQYTRGDRRLAPLRAVRQHRRPDRRPRRARRRRRRGRAAPATERAGRDRSNRDTDRVGGRTPSRPPSRPHARNGGSGPGVYPAPRPRRRCHGVEAPSGPTPGGCHLGPPGSFWSLSWSGTLEPTRS